MSRAGHARPGVARTAIALAAALLTATAAAYRTGPPPGHTGAFGEPDCGECHFDAVRDDSTGVVEIEAPTRFHPGSSYEITVLLRHPELQAAGFQLTTRFVDGDRAGEQAGKLEPAGPRTRVQAGETGVAYLSHTAQGTIPEEAGRATWTGRWTAPAGAGAVAVDVAAQVANDDDSEFGERLYRERRVIRPGAAAGAGQGLPGTR